MPQGCKKIPNTKAECYCSARKYKIPNDEHFGGIKKCKLLNAVGMQGYTKYQMLNPIVV